MQVIILFLVNINIFCLLLWNNIILYYYITIILLSIYLLLLTTPITKGVTALI